VTDSVLFRSMNRMRSVQRGTRYKKSPIKSSLLLQINTTVEKLSP
jgi:hypothetical protein